MNRRSFFKAIAGASATFVSGGAQALECNHDWTPMMKAAEDPPHSGFYRAAIAWEHPFVCSKCGAEKYFSPYSPYSETVL